MTCPKCGMFKRSGIVSCCAPGGAWFENCGVAGNRKMDHKWVEGVKACECKCKVDGMLIFLPRPDRYCVVLPRVCHCICIQASFTSKHQQPERRIRFLYAPSAVSSRNLAKAAVVVAEGLGSENAETPVTQTMNTRGPRASWPATNGRGPIKRPLSSQTLLNSLTCLLGIACPTSQ